MVRIGADQCQVVRILDADGTPLTTGLARTISHDGEIALADVDDSGVLLDYYFGRGERLVVVDLDGVVHEGLLDTRWLTGNRVWWVQTAQPLATVSNIGDTRTAPLDTPEHAVTGRTAPVRRGP